MHTHTVLKDNEVDEVEEEEEVPKVALSPWTDQQLRGRVEGAAVDGVLAAAQDG